MPSTPIGAVQACLDILVAWYLDTEFENEAEAGNFVAAVAADFTMLTQEEAFLRDRDPGDERDR